MNCIISGWSKVLIFWVSLIGVLFLADSCTQNRNPNSKALIPSKEKEAEVNIRSFWSNDLCTDSQGNYQVILLHPAECESCYPVIRDNFTKRIRSVKDGRVLVLLPEILEGIKQHLIKDKLHLDTSKVRLLENNAVWYYLFNKLNSQPFSTSTWLVVSPSGEIVGSEKISPK